MGIAGGVGGVLNPPTTIVNLPTTDRTIVIRGVDDNPTSSFIFPATPPLQGLTPQINIINLLYKYYLYAWAAT